jgi:outer membrane protein OmpA-like peptidoglycan-associated protein
MNQLSKLSLATVMVAALAACQTTPSANPDLAAARSAFEQARSNPYAARAAAVDLERAQQSLRRAEAAAANRADKEEVQELAYVARRRAEAVSALADQAQSEERLQQAGSERDKVRLEARTREAEAAAQRALAAQAAAQRAQADARVAQGQVAQSRQEADAARRQATEQTDAARRQAAEQTEAARRQAAEQVQHAAQLERDLQALRAKPTERGLVVTMGDVLFASGRAELQPGAKRNVDQLANVIKQYPERRVMVEGFTDSQGSEEANLELSQRRAEAFRQELLSAGVPADRIDVQAHGEALPVASNATAAGRQQNRRVEVVFSDEQGQFAGR